MPDVINQHELHEAGRVLDASGRAMVATHLRNEAAVLDVQANDYAGRGQPDDATRARTRADYYRLAAAELIGGIQ